MGFLEGVLGDPGGTTQQSSTTALLTPQDQAAKDKIFSGATAAFDNATRTQNAQGYAGPKFVGPSQDTLNAQNMMRQISGAQGGVAGMVPGVAQFGLADVLDIARNKNLQAAKQASADQLMQSFTQAGGPLANIRSGAMASGGYGGSRQGIAEGLAMKGLASATANANANLDNSAYNAGLQTFNSTINSLPTLLQSLQAPAMTMAGVGANTEGYQQGQENYNANVRDFNVNKDWAPLQQMAQLLYGGMTPGSSTSGRTSNRSSDVQDFGTLLSLGEMAGL